MKVVKLSAMERGWFVGDFEPSVLRTSLFEVGFLSHSKGEHWAPHIHKLADEYNLLVEGKMEICGETLHPGDIFVIEKNQVADPIFLEDCKVVVVKMPSVLGDKYEVTEGEE